MSELVRQSTAHIYRGMWGVLVRWFRVPDKPPTLPVKAEEAIESFQPAEGFLRYLKLWFWIINIIIDLAIMAGWLVATIALAAAGYWWVGLLLLPVALAIAIIPDIFAYVAIHLRYDTTWYVMTERSLRIRRGIWVIHEMTITFENVQNLNVHSGPIQRAFGIANLMVETAGAGGGGEKGQHSVANKGVIEGVANAQELRQQILRRLRQSKTSGLGDDDAPMTTAAAWTPAHLAALREVRDEALALAHGA